MDIRTHRYIAQTPPVDSLPPWSVSKTIKRLMNEVTDKYTDHPQPFLLLSDSEPYCFAPWVDITRAKVAFDRLAIPMLRRDLLKYKSETIVVQALWSLADLIHDPEKACEALRLNILSPLVRLMQHENMFIRHRALEVLRILAGNPFGRATITKHPYIMERLKQNFEDEELLVRSHAYRTVHALAENWFAIEYLLNEGFLTLVIKAIKENMDSPGPSITRSEHLIHLLLTLDYLLDFNETVRIESIRYDIFHLKPLLSDPDAYVRESALKVFTQVFKLKIGRHGASAHSLNEALVPSLDQSEHMKNTLFGALMYTTVQSENKKEAYKQGVLDLAFKTLTNPNTHLSLKRNAAKTLCNLAELPEGRLDLSKSIKEIMTVDTENDKTLETQLDALVNTILGN